MQHHAKHFCERLNKCLNEVGAPNNPRERAAVLGKLLHIPRHHALSLVDGHMIPDEGTLYALAREFEVDEKFFCK